MKTIAKIRQTLLTLITPLMTVSSITVAFPSEASNFFTVSDVELEITNFSPLPHDVAAFVTQDVTTIANIGFVAAQVDLDAIFKVENNSAIAQAHSSTTLLGTGTDYLASANISTTLLGSFFIPVGESLSFDLNSSLFLENFSDDLSFSHSTSASTRLLLQDILNEKVYTIFSMVGVLNTNNDPDLGQDLLQFIPGDGLQIINYEEAILSEGNNEALNINFTGAFEEQFEQGAILNLVATSQTCNYDSNDISVCVRIPEPSNKVVLLLGLFWFIYLVVRSRIM